LPELPTEETPSSSEGSKNREIHTTRRALFWIVGAGLLVRLVVVFLVSMGIAGEVADLRMDHWRFGWETGRIARSLASGQGFSDPLMEPSGPTAWLVPVYPAILGGIFKLLGSYSRASAFAILGFNALVSSLTALPIFFIGRQVFGRRAALAAAWVWALFPYSVYISSTIVWDSTLSAFLLACLTWITLELSSDRQILAWVGYGALWGFGALTNPQVVIALPLALGWLYFRRRRKGRTWLAPACVTLLVSAVAVSPWLVRNYRVFHRPLLMKTNFWLEFTAGNSINQWHWWSDDAHPTRNPAELRKFLEQGELPYMAGKRDEALEFLREHPGTYVWLCLRRFVYVWTGIWSFGHKYLVEEPQDPFNIVFCTAFTLAALLGLRRAFGLASDVAGFLGAILFLVPVLSYLTHPFDFYRHIVDPVLVLLAAPAVLWRRNNRDPWRTKAA